MAQGPTGMHTDTKPRGAYMVASPVAPWSRGLPTIPSVRLLHHDKEESMRPELMYYETMAVQWVSEGISRFFQGIGYQCFSDTVQEIKEAIVPLDRIYAASGRNQFLVFALQFKSPYRRNELLCWKIDQQQQRLLVHDYFSRFIWYCFPFMKDLVSWKNALFHSHFVCPSICKDDLRWFIWDDYFLYFFPGRGGCNEFLGQLRNLPCGEMPYQALEPRLRRGYESKWNFTMNYDSWGTLFYKLMTSQIGFVIKDDSDFGKMKDHLYGTNVPPIKDQAIIISLDIVNKTLRTIILLSPPPRGPDADRGDNDGLFPFKCIDG